MEFPRRIELSKLDGCSSPKPQFLMNPAAKSASVGNAPGGRVPPATCYIQSCTMRLEPLNIQQIGNELAIAWNDGAESYVNLEMLRRACPCAGCGGEPDVLGHIVRPHLNYTNKSFQLTGFDLIGGYALQPRWADGHATGIYSFTYLRRLGQHSG